MIQRCIPFVEAKEAFRQPPVLEAVPTFNTLLRTIRKSFFALCLVMTLVMVPLAVLAEEVKAPAAPVASSVRPVLPLRHQSQPPLRQRPRM